MLENNKIRVCRRKGNPLSFDFASYLSVCGCDASWRTYYEVLQVLGWLSVTSG